MNIGQSKNIKLRDQIFSIEEILNNIESHLQNLYLYTDILDENILNISHPWHIEDINYLNETFNKYLESFNNLLHKRTLLDVKIQEICEEITEFNVYDCSKYFEHLDQINKLINDINPVLDFYNNKIMEIEKEGVLQIKVVPEQIKVVPEESSMTLEQLVLEVKRRGILYAKLIKSDEGLILLHDYIIDDDNIVNIIKDKIFYDRYTTKKLKEMAKENGIKGYSSLKKKEVITKLLS